MKNNFKTLKKTSIKSILAGFVASFTVLSCPSCCFAMNAGDDPVDYSDSSDVSVGSDIFAHEIYDILRCQSETEKKQKFSEILSKHSSQPEEYGKKLNNTVDKVHEKIKGNDTLSDVDIYEIAYATVKGKDITPDMSENNSNNETNPLNDDINRGKKDNYEEDEEDEEEDVR